MKKQTRFCFEDLPKNYAALCRVLLPRPIHDAVEHANVTEVTDAMVLWNEEFTAGQADYFEMLCSLLEEYDDKHVKWPKLSQVDMLTHLMEAQDMSAADLSRLLGGSRNLGAMILRGERKLTLNHVRILAKRFGVSADLFLS
jgi:HTH-type transcriptional regulator/antitoxin HigA